MSSYEYLRRPQSGGKNSPHPPSPLRHASNASNSSDDSSAYSNPSSTYSNPYNVSRTNTVSTNASVDYHPISPPNKRGIGETSPTRENTRPDYQYRKDTVTVAPSYRQDRPHLKTLAQAPNVTLVPTPERMTSRVRFEERDNNVTPTPGSVRREKTPTPSSPDTPASQSSDTVKRFGSIGVSRSDSRRVRPGQNRTPVTPQSSVFESKDLEKFQNSTTDHFKTLSRFASDEKDDFSFSPPEAGDVNAAEGRRRLQQYTADKAKKNGTTPGYGGKIWMDRQRQFMQAYEYLCHIGEAKEWIEQVIEQPIPPIVQLDEALRDGVTLAEVVQSFQKGKTLRIFRNPKLQFRHSDNIAIFFRFLAEVELPELFRFELVDLYDKKNIPKVIYCIHALSWILLQKGMVDFRIGNLVGQLEFEHHELEATQKGLDKAGVSMPNFSGMEKNFGAEIEEPPAPQETEEERLDRELHDSEESILELQSQLRGALIRLRLGDVMQNLWDAEGFFTDLQARIRGDFARQVSEYHLDMKRFSVGLQSIARGYIVRSQNHDQASFWQNHSADILAVQSLVRARKARRQTQATKTSLSRQEKNVKSFQAAIRGALHRRKHDDHRAQIVKVEPAVVQLQQRIRGALQRLQHAEHQEQHHASADQIVALQSQTRGALIRLQLTKMQDQLCAHEPLLVGLQSAIRASHALQRHQKTQSALKKSVNVIAQLQSLVRASQARSTVKQDTHDLKRHAQGVTALQSLARASAIRHEQSKTLASLAKAQPKFLQSAVRGFLTRQKAGGDLEALEHYSTSISDLQAQYRGYQVRKEVQDTLEDLFQYENDFIELQAILRACSVNSKIQADMEELDQEDDTITELQSYLRGFVIRKEFEGKRKHFNENMKKVIKIQSFVRGRQQGKAYESLTNGKNPPVHVVKNFVHLLNDSDFDFDEEIEVEKLRKAVGSRIAEIDHTEQFIDELDIKIGLLAANKIARDEVAKMTKQHGSQQAAARSKGTLNLKTLDKNARAKLDHYQKLFATLQTEYVYLARLFLRYRERAASEEELRRLELLTMTSFGHAQKRREEFHLLRLITTAVDAEAGVCQSMQDFMRGNFFFNRLFATYTRAPKDRRFVRDVIGPMIKTSIIENRTLDLESDPLQIYRAIINNEELSTGLQSSRPLDIPREQAIKDPETRSAFINHLQDMRDLVGHFISTMEESVTRIPYGPRFIAREMYRILCYQFPDEEQDIILQQIGQWLWRTYLKPALVEPEKSGATERGLDPPQRRNLYEFVKVVNQVVSGRLFGDDNVYLQPLNSYVTEAIDQLMRVWERCIEVDDPDSYFDIDVHDDVHAKVPPTLHIKLGDMFSIHQIIADNLPSLCINHEDMELRDIVAELGSAKSNEAELSANTSEVTLSLSGKFHNRPDPDADVKQLLMETKRCILFIIRVQAGPSLMEIMVKPITQEDEERWSALVREEMSSGLKRAGTYRGRPMRPFSTIDSSTASIATSDNSNLADLSTLSYPELKQIALENIVALERRGRISRSNKWQDLLNEIALDIRLKHKRRVQRQKEAEEVRQTLDALDSKSSYLDEKLKAYNDTFEQNLNHLQNKKAKRGLQMPFSTQWIHERELKKAGVMPRYGSFKYRAQTLAERGILVSWRGYDVRDVEITISSDEVNEFTIQGSNGTLLLPGCSQRFQWDDLIEAQYQKLREYRFFTGNGGRGELVVDTNAFMQKLSKKFWPEG